MPNEVTTIRIIHANQHIVFKAWTDPERLKNWWGPNGFTNTFHVFDLKPGGKWSFIMHSPDGKDFPNESIFVEINEPHHLVFDHICEPFFRADVNFEKLNNNQTKIVWKMIFQEKESFDKLSAFIGEKNEENMNRLVVEIEKMK